MWFEIMVEKISRTEQKRLFKQVEDLAKELAELTNRDLNNLPAEEEVKEALIAAENKDRKAIYLHFAKQQNTTLEVVENVQAKRKAEKAKPGQFIQLPEGQWVKK